MSFTIAEHDNAILAQLIKETLNFVKKISQVSEVVVRRCSVKKVFLKSLTKFTRKHLENTYFYRTPLVAASEVLLKTLQERLSQNLPITLECKIYGST